MARFLSADWVDAFNAALAGVDLSPEVAGATGGSLTAAAGPFTVAQDVHGVPGEGNVRTVLTVDGGSIALALEEGGGTARATTVAIALAYDDAAALARGELDPSDALSRGRIRVRGDLAVLVAAQGVLAAASARLAPLQADTTY